MKRRTAHVRGEVELPGAALGGHLRGRPGHPTVASAEDSTPGSVPREPGPLAVPGWRARALAASGLASTQKYFKTTSY